MSQLLIRQVNAEDTAQIAALDKECFSVPWSYNDFLNEFTVNERAFYIAAEIDEKIVGYVGMWKIFDEGHITNVAVAPGFRRKHIAKAMLSVFIEEGIKEGLRAFTLEVRASNEPAISLYRGFGFEEAGVRKNYYEGKEDALIMWLQV